MFLSVVFQNFWNDFATFTTVFDSLTVVYFTVIHILTALSYRFYN